MQVKIKQGMAAGVDYGGYTEFRGIPFAKPPIGNLRWKAPEEPESWDGIRKFDTFPAKAMQSPGRPGRYQKEFYDNPQYVRAVSEDCLYVNIWTPKRKENAELCPVAFWIHGGGFSGGYGSELEFDGKEYCARGVMLVTIQYRLGVFGYLAHPWLNEENEKKISGNYGVLDQIAALKWVYENIEAFGGDKDNITVFGQSAGAMSAQVLIGSELSKNMISKAIMQSGATYQEGLHNHITLEKQMWFGERFSEILGAKSLSEMREKDAGEIQHAMELLIKEYVRGPKELFFSPTIDGYVLENNVYNLMDAGKIRNIPYMLGTTANDILVPQKEEVKKEDSLLHRGVVAFAKKLEELGRASAYLYYFSRKLPGDNAGAFHSSELWYVFGTLERCWRPMEQRDYDLSKKMLDCWTGFMKTGKPADETVWRPYSEEHPEIMEFE